MLRIPHREACGEIGREVFLLHTEEEGNEPVDDVVKVMFVKVPCHSDSITPPLGIGYIASNIRDIAKVSIIDAIKDDLNARRFTKVLREFGPDVVGFSIVTSAAQNAVEFISAARAALPRAAIVAGGPHATIASKHLMAACAGKLDFILRGECEHSFRSFLLNFVDGEHDRKNLARYVPGFFSEVDGAYVANETPSITDVNSIAMPAWDLMRPDAYPRAPHGAFYRKFPVAPVISSRGCAFECSFCSVRRLFGRSIRLRAPRLIADEIECLKKDYGVKEFQIIDDNFTLCREHALGVCDELVRRGIAMPWSCPNGVRIDKLDTEILDAMKKSGCYSISLGIESGSEDVLRLMDKRLNLEAVPRIVEMIVSRGMEANGFFIYGYPGETRADAKKTLRLAKSLPLTRANFALYSPLPGTRAYDEMNEGVKARYLSSPNYFGHSAFVPDDHTRFGLKTMQRRSILEFYARPRQGLSLFRGVCNPQVFYYFMRRAYHWVWGR
jgi:radical SAM superfamily enzyme YgiQ (UPF0313 family)